MNENAHNVVQLRIARDGRVHPSGAANTLKRQPSWNSEAAANGQSIARGQFLEQLEAENRQLRAEAVDLALQIRALRDSIAAALIGHSPHTRPKPTRARRLVNSGGGDGLSLGLVILPLDAPGRRSGCPWPHPPGASAGGSPFWRVLGPTTERLRAMGGSW